MRHPLGDKEKDRPAGRSFLLLALGAYADILAIVRRFALGALGAGQRVLARYRVISALE